MTRLYYLIVQKQVCISKLYIGETLSLLNFPFPPCSGFTFKDTALAWFLSTNEKQKMFLSIFGSCIGVSELIFHGKCA